MEVHKLFTLFYQRCDIILFDKLSLYMDLVSVWRVLNHYDISMQGKIRKGWVFMKKRLLTTILSTCMLASVLTGCGAKDKESSTQKPDSAAVVETAATNDLSDETMGEVDDSSSETDYYMSLITMNVSDVDAYAGLYGEIKAIEPFDVAGEWNRTNTFSDTMATLTISSVTEEGFDFSVLSYFQDQFSEFNSHASWVAEGVAIAKSEEFGTEYILFTLNSDTLNVYCSDFCNSLGLAMNVTIDGAYTTGDPVYVD